MIREILEARVSSPFPSRCVAVLATGICLAIFLIDLVTPLGYAVPLLYGLPLLLTLWIAADSAPLWVAAFGTLLIIAGYYKVSPGGSEHIGLVNRGLVIALGWALAGLLVGFKRTQARLLASDGARQMTQHAIDQASDAVLFADQDMRIVYVNEAACRSLGYTREELLALRLQDIAPRHDPKVDADRITGLSRDGAIRYESAHRRKDGSEFPIDLSVSYLVHEGRPVMCVIARDMTARKRAEEELRRSELVIRSIVDNLPVMVFVKTADGLRFVRFNKAAEEIVGLTEAEVLGKNDYDFFPKKQADFFVARDREVLKRGGVVDIPAEPIQTRGRGLRYLHTKKFVLHDEAGRPQFLVGVSEDVTERRQAEEALRASEERYRAVVEDQTEVISRLRTDGTLSFVNDVYCRFFGKPREELVGHRWQPVAHVEDLPRIEAELRTLSPSRPIVVIENRVYAAGGAVRWMQFVNRGFFDGAGRLVEIQSVGRDITDRKEAEEALFRASTLMKAVADSTPIGIATTDAEGCLTSWSPALERLFGWREQDVLGRQSPLIPSGKESEAEELWQAAMRGEHLNGVEVQRCRKDGALLDVQIWGGALRDHGGRIVGTVGIVADISARKRTEAALQESEARFRSAFELSPTGMVLATPGGILLRVNKRFCEMLGYTEEELLGKHFTAITHPDDCARSMAGAERVKRGEEPAFRDEKRYLRKTGEVLWGRLTLTSLRDREGRVLYFLAQVEDLTDLRRVETERNQALMARERLGRDLHDGILQSLYATGLALETTQQVMKAQPSKGRSLLEQAMQQLDGVMREVRRFIGDIDTGPVWEEDWASAVRDLVESQAAIHQAEGEVSLDPNAVRRLGPEVRVYLMNLIREAVSNSVRHGRPSHLTVRLSQDEGALRLSIKDDGRGFHLTSVGQGGHGLRNMKARADHLGARFRIVSELGEGTEVSVDLPQEEIHARSE